MTSYSCRSNPPVMKSACLLVALFAMAHGFKEPQGDRIFSALELPLHTEQLREVLKAVNQVLTRSSGPEGLLESLSYAEGETLQDEDNKQCLSDLARWEKAVNSGESWALKMVDSTSKFVTGILYGQNADLGDFDECVESTPGALGTGDDFTGLYALPTLAVYTAVEDSPNNTVYKKAVKVRFAMCAPSTCSAEYLQTALRRQLGSINEFIGKKGLKLEAALDNKLTSQYSGYRQPNASDWSIAGLAIFFVVVVAIATTTDLVLGPDRVGLEAGCRLLCHSEREEAASGVGGAFRAFRGVWGVRGSGGEMLGCVHGMRVFSMLWIVQGHRWVTSAITVPYTNAEVQLKYFQGNYAFTITVMDAILSVDTFFVIGGIVNTYVFMKVVQKTNSFNVLQYYIHRYVRLTPSLMFVLAVSATWFSLLGNGPLWYSVHQMSAECQQSWWTHMLYVSNYVRVEHPCHVLWYPSADMQLFWVSPLVLVPLWKRPRIGVPWLMFLIVVSCVVPLAISLVRGYRFVVPLMNEIAGAAAWREQYLGAHMRATPYFVGLLTGYFLYLIKVEKRPFKLSTIQTVSMWLVMTALSIVVLTSACPLYDSLHVEYNQLASGFYIGLARLCWSIVMSWIVVACVTGHGGPVNAILSWSPLAVVGRLTYGIYLVHHLVQEIDFGLYRTAEFYNPFKMTHRTVADFFLATILAAALSLMLESPILSIEKWLWQKQNPDELPRTKKLPVAD